MSNSVPNNAAMARFVNLIGGAGNLPPIAPASSVPAAVVPRTSSPNQDLEEWESLLSLAQIRQLNAQFAEEAKNERQLRVQLQSQDQAHPAPWPKRKTSPPRAPAVNIGARTALELGDPAPRDISFCPFIAVTKFCYKFVSREWMQSLATAFFDANKIYQREWDIYYVWSKHYETTKALTLVPEHQFIALLNEINTAFPEANITLTDELRGEGLVLDFDNLEDELRPVFLAHCNTREKYEEVSSYPPFPSMEPRSPGPADRSLAAYRDLMERGAEVNRMKKKAQKAARQEAAAKNRQGMRDQVLRAQRYLGLLGVGGAAEAIQVEKPTAFDPDLDAIFIAIDCEAYERLPKTVTEVGIATLDTRDLKGVAPGLHGQNWQKMIRSRHFRIIEFKELRNTDFVAGCPDRFEFGDSEFVAAKDIPSTLTKCFHPPFSKLSPAPTLTESMQQLELSKKPTEEKRNIVLLGHDTSADIYYLQLLGFSVLNRGNLLEVMDTAVMFRAYTRDVNPGALGKILLHFDMTGWHLHNAGNDAVYTIWSMLAICVASASERGSEVAEKKHEETKERRMQEAVERAKERVEDEAFGWGLVDGRERGGPAGPPQQSRAKKSVYGPPKPPPQQRYYTTGGAPLDV